MRTEYAGFVYLFQYQDVVKIGFAKNVARRLKEVQLGFPFDLVIAGYFRGDVKLERAIHRWAHEDRIRRGGEWFRMGDRVKELMQALKYGKTEGVLQLIGGEDGPVFRNRMREAFRGPAELDENTKFSRAGVRRVHVIDSIGSFRYS